MATTAGKLATDTAGKAARGVSGALNPKKRDSTDVAPSGSGDAVTNHIQANKSSIEIGESDLVVESVPLATAEEECEESHNTAPTVTEADFAPSPIFAVGSLVVYILCGTYLYASWEKEWNYFESAYFIFISITTVGLGDLTPSKPDKFIASSLYILLGLCLVSFVINCLLLYVQNFLAKAKRKKAELMDILRSEKDNDESSKSKRGWTNRRSSDPVFIKSSSSLGILGISPTQSPSKHQNSYPALDNIKHTSDRALYMLDDADEKSNSQYLEQPVEVQV